MKNKKKIREVFHSAGGEELSRIAESCKVVSDEKKEELYRRITMNEEKRNINIEYGDSVHGVEVRKKSGLKRGLSIAACGVLTVGAVGGAFIHHGLHNVSPADEISEEVPEEIPEEVVDEDIVLTMAVWSDDEDNNIYKEAVDRFNEEDNGYRIEFKAYEDEYPGDIEYDSTYVENREAYFDNLQAVQDKYNEDALNGAFDITISYASGGRNDFERLAAKGAFADLNTIMAMDENFDRTSLNSHVLSLFEHDGQLFYMPQGYFIQTRRGETKYAGDKENWTFDEMVEHWNQMPEGSAVGGGGYTSRFYTYLELIRDDMGRFFDYYTGEVNFDSEEFINYLRFIENFDAEPDGFTKPDYNYFAPQLTSNTPIYGFGGYHAAVWPILPGSDEEHEWCLVGYPSENGSGSYIAPLNELAVSAFSDEKEQYGAWLFIKELVSYDMQYRTPGEDVAAYPAEGFPINNEAFEQIAAEASAHEGEPNYGTASGIETDAGNITAAEVEACKELINSIDRSGAFLDDELFNATNEELEPFFRGEITAEECAANLQTRVESIINS